MFADIFDDVSNLLDFFLNVLEIIALIVSVFTFFFLMLNKYSKALKKILGPCGLGFFARIKALFICRKSQIKKRAFLEYAILRTGGCPVIASEWSIIINGFKSFYIEAEQGDLIYHIPNCTPLITTEFSVAVDRYFNYFSQDKIKKAFGIHEDLISWVIKIRIEEAYATPTCLLTGLLSQYNENWEEFIKKYVSTAYINDSDSENSNNVLTNELYFTFAWLLWGPSYEIEYKNYWAGLCQLSYGDESNSVPAIADSESDVAEKLKEKFLENEGRRYGALISADVSIYEKRSFYESIYANINPENLYFYEKIKKGDMSFAIKIDDYIPCLNYKAKKYYSTAYVWILFETEDDEYAFRPEKSVAFFEHANLASKETYQFLIETLIDKSLKHFEQIYSDPQNLNRKYRFICAMNSRIANICINKYREIMNSGTEFGNLIKERIILEPKHSSAEVFSAYDEFFAASNLVSFVNVSCEDKATISLLGQFYTDIYMDVFPDENERETFDNFIKYLKTDKDHTEYNYHIVLAKDENDVVIGGCIFDYFKRTNTGVIEFLAVKSDIQSSGVGTQIYNHVLNILSDDAFKVHGKPLTYVCCEIDSPEYSRAEVKKYLYFWNKNNYMHMEFKYIQPALSDNQQPVTGLWFTISPQHGAVKRVPSEVVQNILYDYIRYAMDIEKPENNKEYIAMVKELKSKEYVELSRIIN